jgi:hypothetical protein
MNRFVLHFTIQRDFYSEICNSGIVFDDFSIAALTWA